MGRSETEGVPPCGVAGPFLAGVMLAFGAFLVLFRFELVGLPLRAPAGLGPAAALAGLSMGLAQGGRLTRRGRLLAALDALLLWTLWAAFPSLGLLLTALAGVGGFALLGMTLANGIAAAPATVAVGVAAGGLACATGTMEVVGLAPAVGGVAFLAAVGSFCRAECRVSPRPEGGGERLLVSAALGLTAASLLRAYLPATRSLAFAGADLAVAAALGYLAASAVTRREATGATNLLLGALICLGVSLLCGFSWFLYPDLVVGEPAALQTPSALLVAGRTFPFWLLAAATGVGARLIVRGPAGLMAAAAGGACAGLFAGSIRAPYVLTAGLIAAATLPVALRQYRGGHAARSLAGATLALALAGMAFAAAADPWRGWRPLRERLADRLSVGKEVVSADQFALAGWRLAGAGLHTRWSFAGGGAEFVNGNLSHLRASGEPASEALDLAVALAAAFGDGAGRIALARPALTAMGERARGVGGGAGPPGAVVAGPGPLSGFGDPLVVLSVEGLERLREQVGPRGVVCLCLPVGRMNLESLRRVLAGVQGVFPDCAAFVHGDVAVLVAGQALATSCDALRRAMAGMVDGAAWHPLDPMVSFTAGRAHLAVLARGAEPFRLSRPSRPRPAARDLATEPDPEALAALVQYRQLGPERALAMVEFPDAAARAVAARGFQDAYADLTWTQLHAIGRMDAAGAPRLRAFLHGRHAQWGLFAGRQEPPAVRMASALTAFGRYHSAAELLRGALSREPDDVPTLLALAGLYAGPLGQPEAAAAVARRVLELDPRNPAAERLRALAAGRSR